MRDLEAEIKALIIDVLYLEDMTVADIDSKTLLFGGGLGLDSIDALELGLELQKKYNIKINAESEDTKTHFSSVENLAKFIQAQNN